MSFRTLSGHRALRELLARAIARGTLPPSLIFSGPEGVGKRTTAVALAQALNCERPVEWPAADGGDAGVDACGECASCRRIARGVHADVIVLEPEDTAAIKIEPTRDVIEKAGYRPFEGRRRVVIIDPADALVLQAQDALLKTLEEPPPSSVFVLVSSIPDTLLSTIRSRCQVLRFGPLSSADVARVLVDEHEFSETDARAAAATSEGSIGRALEGTAEEQQEAHALAARLLAAVAGSHDPRRRLDGAKVFTGPNIDRDTLSIRLRAMSSLVRDIALVVSGGDASAMANADARHVEALARAFDADRAIHAFAIVDRALSALDRNASPKIVADWVAMNL